MLGLWAHDLPTHCKARATKQQSTTYSHASLVTDGQQMLFGLCCLVLLAIVGYGIMAYGALVVKHHGVWLEHHLVLQLASLHPNTFASGLEFHKFKARLRTSTAAF